jgi:hypothetical protein
VAVHHNRKGCPPEGEEFNLKVLESDKMPGIPEFDINLQFNNKHDKKYGKWRSIFGYVETEIEPTSDTPITNLTLNLKLPEDQKLKRHYPKLKITKNGKTHNLPYKSYKITKNKKDELEINIDFTRGIVFDRRKHWKNLWKEVKQKCLTEWKSYKNFRQCYDNLKDNFVNEDSIMFALRKGDKFEVSFPIWIWGKEDEYIVKALATAVGPTGEQFTKGKELDLLS